VLRLAEADAALGRLDDARLENIQLENIHKTVSEIIEDLAAREAPNVPVPREAASGKGKIINIDTRKLGSSVFCIPGLGRLDDCAALVAADVLKRQGIVARTAGRPPSRRTMRRRYASAFWRMLRKPGPTLLGESFRARHPPQKSSSACWESRTRIETATILPETATILPMMSRRGH
jgi:hypothetical protein